QLVVVAGHLLGDLQLLDDAAPQPAGATGPPDPDAHSVKLVAAAVDHVAVEAHQPADLVRGAFPVLGGEGVRGQVLHAEFDSALDHVEEGVLAAFVAADAGQAAL